MSRRNLGPLPDLQIGWALPTAVVVFAVGFALAWRFVPVGVDVSVTVFAFSLGLVVAISFVARVSHEANWTHSQFIEIGRREPPPPTRRAKDLVEFEAMVAGATRYQHDLYLKVRPQLRYLAWTRLAARGISLDHDPRAAELLGDLYEFVKEDAVRPGRLFGEGVALESLESMVETLERI